MARIGRVATIPWVPGRPGGIIAIVALVAALVIAAITASAGVAANFNQSTAPLTRPSAASDDLFGAAAPVVADAYFKQFEVASRRVTESRVVSTEVALATGLAPREAYTVAAKRAVAAGKKSQGYIWPTWGTLTGWFGEDRFTHLHAGVDIAGPPGTPVLAVADGVVESAGLEEGAAYGVAVVVDHGRGVKTLYAHFDQIDVVVGERVVQGQAIGAMGCTGRCTGNHLHFEVRINGASVDPFSHLPS